MADVGRIFAGHQQNITKALGCDNACFGNGLVQRQPATVAAMVGR